MDQESQLGRIKVFVNQTVEALKNSPEYRPETLNRDYEAKLYRHYDWAGLLGRRTARPPPVGR